MDWGTSAPIVGSESSTKDVGSPPAPVRLVRRYLHFLVRHYRHPLHQNVWFWGFLLISAFLSGWNAAEGDFGNALVLAAGAWVYAGGIVEHSVRNFIAGLREQD